MGERIQPAVGQAWRRKSDGLLCRVLEVTTSRVRYEGFRRQWKLTAAFEREFEYAGRVTTRAGIPGEGETR